MRAAFSRNLCSVSSDTTEDLDESRMKVGLHSDRVVTQLCAAEAEHMPGME